jgi:hypothetical protein
MLFTGGTGSHPPEDRDIPAGRATMIRKTFLTTLILILTLATTGAAGDRWLHVAVDGKYEDGERVRVNVPLSLVEAVIPLIEDDDFHGGCIVIEDEEFEREELVALLAAVRDAEDGEYVTVEDGEDHVRVSKRDEYFHIDVDEGPYGDQVEVKFPMEVLTAMLSGDDDELDLMAGIEALGKHGEGELVTVNDDEAVVRVWIDDRNQSD